ncbi:AlkA N-terminal domain-containing protein [Virgisporangium aurantiacum]|uniref:AlkA N-terminal domain-containing protein n=1 Tax=Virgisporangium aurantiacum TaxID=175570 RepID=UPI00195198C8|nr:AlkA N-terminal domain-containing protein [Virgisporangium aurantiacum]
MTTFSAVITTGIYCRPGCGARPNAENVRTFEHPAAAEAAGFRACLQCRPYRVAGAVPWNAPELVCRAVRLILDGVLDTGSEAELGRRLGLSSRHLRRLFHEHLGLTPDQLARSRRAHFARRMLDDTDLTVADVAFASGFGSLRQFNRTMREIFRHSPQDLRRRRRRADRIATDGGLALRLPVSADYDWAAAVGLLAREAIPGVEAVEGGTYRRTITLDGAPGLLEVHGVGGYLVVHAHLPFWEGLIHAMERVRRMLGLDFDLEPALAHFAADPVLGPLVKARPGLRVPGAWGPFEAAVRVVIGRHHADPQRLMGVLAKTFGTPVPGLPHGLSHAFPAPEVIADADLRAAGLPVKVAATVSGFAAAVVDGGIRLDGSVGLDVLVAALTSVTGINAATAQRVAIRLGERDAYPLGDPALPDAAAAEGWRPWRALAATHLTENADVS